MSKDIHLCKDGPSELQTQSRYTPDVGVVDDEASVFCGVCESEMRKTPSVNGARGFAMALAGDKSLHDVFTCPHREEDWHKQVVALRNEARETSSFKLKNMLLDEADDILELREATVDVGPFKGN